MSVCNNKKLFKPDRGVSLVSLGFDDPLRLSTQLASSIPLFPFFVCYNTNTEKRFLIMHLVIYLKVYLLLYSVEMIL